MTDESVFAAAVAIPNPTDRAAFLDRACAGNPAVPARFEAWLRRTRSTRLWGVA